MLLTDIVKLAPVMPVIILEDSRDAVPLAEAILAGGIRVMEVTLRTEAALPAIEAISRALPVMCVGAGTVITPTQFTQIQAAGARFAVSPGISPALLDQAKTLGIPYLPGVATSSDIMTAINHGYTLLKSYPTALLGGIPWLMAQHNVFRKIQFFPSGGLNKDNFTDYLALDHVVGVSGSWIAPTDVIKRKDWGAITHEVKQALMLAQGSV